MSLALSMLQSADVSRLGWTLLHSLWQGAAIAALLAIALFALRRSSSQSRYASSCFAMAMLLVLPITTFCFLKPALVPETHAVQLPAMPAALPATPTARSALYSTTPANAPVRVRQPSSDMPAPMPPLIAVQPSQEPPHQKIHAQAILPWLVLMWAIGVVGLSVWNFGGWIALRRVKSTGVLPAPASLEVAAVELARRLQIPRAFRVVQSVRACSPMVVGAFKPIILIPVAVLAELPAAQLESILAHELAHIRRHDYGVNLIQSVIETLLFYHPATWWISRIIRTERENCCDDIALSVCGNRATYATALANIAAPRDTQLAVAATGGVLLNRVRRVLGLPTRDSRRNGWAAGALCMAACLIFLTIIIAPQRSKAQASKPATTQAAGARTLKVTFIDPTTGKPAAGVTGSFWTGRQTSDNVKKYETDATGQFSLEINDATPSLEFFYKKEGFVEGLAHYGSDYGSVAKIPASVELRLEKGLTIGGTVVDQDAKPVSEAKVQLTFMVADSNVPGGQAVRYGYITTDTAGRWTFNGAPANPNRIAVFTRHPDVVLASMNHDYESGSWKNLLDQQLVSTVRRGIVVRGTVADEKDVAIPDADVTPTAFGYVSAMKADAKGEFELHGVDNGSQVLMARAPGFAPDLIEIAAKPDMPLTHFHLKKGRTVHGRVVTEGGKAVPGGFLTIEKWRNVARTGIGVRPDADGHFTLPDAPIDAFDLVANTRTLNGEIKRHVDADVTEVTITVPDPIVARGSVVYDDTNKPVPAFRVHIWEQGDPYSTSMDRTAVDGKYEVTDLSKAKWYSVRVDVPGYIPSESDHLLAKDAVVQFDARLKKTGAIWGSLVSADGKPVSGADVILTDMMGASMHNGIMEPSLRTQCYSTLTDAAGKFSIPNRKGKIRLFVTHDTGWALVDVQAEAIGKITLRPWCTIEGTTVSTGKPLANQTVWLEPTPVKDDNAPNVWGFQYSTETDANGHFKLTRVADADWNIGIRCTVKETDGRVSYVSSEQRMIHLEPGEHKTDVQIGGIGRKLVGKVELSPNLKVHNEHPTYGSLSLNQPSLVPPAGWENFTPAQKKAVRDAFDAGTEMRDYNQRVHEYTFPVNTDGSFTIEDVAAGEYTITVDVQKPSKEQPNNYHWVALGEKPVSVAELGNSKLGESTDIGTVTMADFNHPEAGEAAPDFSLKSLDGQSLKLADYRGKVVLLDFWATWCGPCVAEMPTLKAVHVQFGGNPNFVMIGLSDDRSADAPRKFALAHQISWPQTLVTGGPGNATRSAYGVSGIPVLVLIGPDGKIIKMDLQEKEIGPAVEAALKALAR